jgi:Sigma-70, region 4
MKSKITRDISVVPFPSVRLSKGRFENGAKATIGRSGCRKNGFIIPEPSNGLVYLFEDLLQGFDQRHLRIMYLRTFRIASGRTLQDLGNDFGVSRERVRQMESDCIKTIARRLKTTRFQPLIEASARITAAIGLAVPISMANPAGFLSCQSPIGSIKTPSAASLMRAFLLWWGGSYELTNEWMIRQPAARYIRKTRIVTNSLLKPGPAPADQLIGKVCALGFRRDVIPQWVAAFGQARILGSVAIRWKGNLADKAIALLEFQREPMGREHISVLLGPDHCIRTLSNYLSTDDRFKRVGLNLFGLSKWGGNEYHTIADTIEDVIHTAGGEATVTHIISQVLARTGVLESSIRKYLYGPRFHLSDSGSYRLRQATVGRPSGR